ncbi:MAG: fructose 1,6-bisphosphatase, partial [Candidatus Promineifilaceae bacterium]
MLTISAIKADVGSIGGHTRPSDRMLAVAKASLARAVEQNVITDFDVTHTGDDICLLMVHRLGSGNAEIHNLAWR